MEHIHANRSEYDKKISLPVLGNQISQSNNIQVDLYLKILK
jgi:hypothetical protein